MLIPRVAFAVLIAVAVSPVPAQHENNQQSTTQSTTQPTTQTTTQTTTNPNRSAADQYRARVASDLQQAAKRVGVRIDESKTVLVTRDDAFVALAPAYEKKDVFLFMQASLSEAACAKVLPEGYYSVKIVPVAKGNPTQGVFINSEGKVVTTGHLMSETRRARPEEKDKLQVGVQLRHTGGAVASTTLGVCRCQWIPWFRWRRLHIVVT